MPDRHEKVDGVRQMHSSRAVKVIAVASGKGGVGKTTVSVNLSVALARAGRRVMLLDADLGLANVDVHLGLQPRRDLSDVIAGRCGLEEIILSGPLGIRVVPGASGKQHMTALSKAEYAGLIHAFGELTQELDVLVVDTPAGIADGVASFAQAAHEVLVVVCDEPASITDAYALIKVLSREGRVQRFQILTNQSRDPDGGEKLFSKILRVSDRFLDVRLEHAGNIPADTHVYRAVQRQMPVVEQFPGSRAARAFELLARRCDRWSVPQQARGHVEFFAERLFSDPAAQEVVAG